MMLKGLGVDKHSNANELMKKPAKERTVPKIHDFEPNATHQMDLVYLSHDKVKKTKYRYALSVMDTATRLGDAEPMSDRRPEDVIAALKKIYKRGPLKKPSLRITTDNGSEFKGAFNTWVEDQGLIHKTARTGNSRQVALAEYLNYIIGRYVALYQHSKEDETGVTNREWVSNLPIIIGNYNEWIKKKQEPEGDKKPMTPDEERKEKMESLGPVRCKGQSCRLLEVGTKVRAIRIKPKDDVTGKRLHGGFRAGDKRWETTIRTVEKIILKAGQPPLYKLSGIDDATYTRERIQVVGKENEEINTNKEKWIIEKIVKRTTKQGEIFYQIKWKGWAKKHNTEEPREQLMEDVPDMVENYEDKHPLTKAQQAKANKQSKQTVAKNVLQALNKSKQPKKKPAKRTKKALPVAQPAGPRRSARIASSSYVKKRIGS